MRCPRSNNDTTRLGYTSTKEGESSKSGEQRNANGKNSKSPCHSCGQIGHTTNVCRRNTINKNPK